MVCQFKVEVPETSSFLSQGVSQHTRTLRSRQLDMHNLSVRVIPFIEHVMHFPSYEFAQLVVT